MHVTLPFVVSICALYIIKNERKSARKCRLLSVGIENKTCATWLVWYCMRKSFAKTSDHKLKRKITNLKLDNVFLFITIKKLFVNLSVAESSRNCYDCATRECVCVSQLDRCRCARIFSSAKQMRRENHNNLWKVRGMILFEIFNSRVGTIKCHFFCDLMAILGMFWLFRALFFLFLSS